MRSTQKSSKSTSSPSSLASPERRMCAVSVQMPFPGTIRRIRKSIADLARPYRAIVVRWMRSTRLAVPFIDRRSADHKNLLSMVANSAAISASLMPNAETAIVGRPGASVRIDVAADHVNRSGKHRPNESCVFRPMIDRAAKRQLLKDGAGLVGNVPGLIVPTPITPWALTATIEVRRRISNQLSTGHSLV